MSKLKKSIESQIELLDKTGTVCTYPQFQTNEAEYFFVVKT